MGLDALSRWGEGVLPRTASRGVPVLDDGWRSILTLRGLDRAAPAVRRQALRCDGDVVLVILEVVDETPPDAADQVSRSRLAARARVEDHGGLVGDLLQVSVRTTDRVARASSDVFAVLLAAGPAFAGDTAERLHRGSRRVLRPYGLGVRSGTARREPVDCPSPVETWLPGMLDEAAVQARLR